MADLDFDEVPERSLTRLETDRDSFGLEVTTGAVGLDDQLMVAAHEAAREIGMQVVRG